MKAQKMLYEVNLPDGFDYMGLADNLSGTVLASSQRQAVRSFILKQAGLLATVNLSANE